MGQGDGDGAAFFGPLRPPAGRGFPRAAGLVGRRRPRAEAEAAPDVSRQTCQAGAAAGHFDAGSPAHDAGHAAARSDRAAAQTPDRARTALSGFLRRASEDGWRAVLVVTGKGSRGDGILRRMTPEWLADPALRDIVAGVSEAHRTHGGGGALYVALKRRSRA